MSGSMGHDHIPETSIKFQQSIHKQGDNGVQNTSAFIVDADGSGLGVQKIPGILVGDQEDVACQK